MPLARTSAGKSSPNSSPRPSAGSSPSIATCCSTSLLPHSTARLGRPARLAQHLFGLALDGRAEGLVGERVVEVGEHEVLPHEDARARRRGRGTARPRTALVPGMRSMFMPASRTCSSAARSAPAAGARPMASSGVQTAPAGEHAHAVDVQVEPVLSALRGRRSLPPPRSRKPTRPARSITARILRCGDRLAAHQTRVAAHEQSCSAGSPWVCGHQRATSGTTQLAARLDSHPRRATSASGARRVPDGPDELHLDAVIGAVPRGCAGAPVPPARRPRRTRRGRSVSSSTTRRRRRSRRTARHGPTAAGPGAKPGSRPSSIVRKKRRLPSATRRVRQRARGRRGGRSSGVSARQRIASSLRAAQARPPRRARGPRTSSRSRARARR